MSRGLTNMINANRKLENIAVERRSTVFEGGNNLLTMCTKSISTSDGDLLMILTDCSDDGDGEKKTLAETPGGRIQVFLKRRDSPGDQNYTIENFENIFYRPNISPQTTFLYKSFSMSCPTRLC